MNNEFIIVTEGKFDAKVIEKLFQEKKLNNKIEILSANGYSSALSKVKSFLSLGKKNIILVLDTDSVDEFEIKEKEDFVNSYVNTKVNQSNFKAFWAIPEFEIIFLNNKKFMNALIPHKIDDNIVSIGKNSPKKTLETISGKKREQFIDLIEEQNIKDAFFEDGLIKDITEYIGQ